MNFIKKKSNLKLSFQEPTPPIPREPMPPPVQTTPPAVANPPESPAKQSLEALLRGEKSQPKKEKRKPVNYSRPFETHIRFTEQEFAELEERIRKSGLRQSDFIRQAALKNEIRVDPNSVERLRSIREMNAELVRLRGELGKLGGLLKMTINPNKEQHSLDGESWDTLISAVHALFRLQKEVEKILEVLRGRPDYQFQ